MSSSDQYGSEAELSDKCERAHRRSQARRPKGIGKVLAQVITTRGYGRIETDRQLQSAWQAAVGEQLAGSSRACRVYRGKLEVLVANSATRQELEFQRGQILASLARLLPELRVGGLRFRVGRL